MSQRFKTPQAEESVACNLIPMIDIMFLLLLFFMLGADMSQRELEEVELPKADQVKDDSKENEGGSKRTNVNIFHVHTSSGFTCQTHMTGGICRDMSHWAIAIRSKELTIETLPPALKDEADRDMEAPDPKAGPGAKPLSKQEVMIRADKNAPYGYIQKVIEACASVGIYRIACGAARPDGAK